MRIGLVLNVLDEEYQISIYRGIKNCAIEKGIDLICFQHQNTSINDNPLIVNYSNNKKSYFNVDGIILLTSVLVDSNDYRTKDDVERIWGKIPVVSMGQKIKGIPSFLIKTDDSMKELVEHLVMHHKYRNFFYMSGPQNHADAITREKVFTQMMDKYSALYPELKYKIKHGMFTQHAAIKVMEEFFLENPGENLDVVVCANDTMALGVYKFFKMNQDNPDVKECAVTGFDDIPQAKFEIPAFTTIRQPLAEIGEKSLNALIDIINGKTVEDEVYASSKLIVRDSCGCNTTMNDEKWRANYLQQIQLRYIQSDHYLKLVARSSMDLNSSESFEGIRYVVNNCMEQLGVKDFCILVGSDRVKPLYVRCNNNYMYHFYDNEECSLSVFYERFLKERNQQSTCLIYKKLYSGKQLVGSMLYDGSHTLLPYLVTVTVNIAHSIVRVQEEEEKKKHSAWLEREVVARTKELVEANNKRMEVEAQVLQISEMERFRFSTDLHDDICQRLAGISMLCRCYANQDKAISKSDMSELAQLISDTLQATRQYAHNSYPVELERLGLKDSIENLCNSFEKQQGIKCGWFWNVNEKVDFDNIQKLNIFRIIQEGLHNVAKHSHARNVNVSVTQDKDTIFVKIDDDGIGMPKNTGEIKTGMGINSMIYRANQMDATFYIVPNEKGGTCIDVQMKIKDKNE